jgi:predicted transcriptional regulator
MVYVTTKDMKHVMLRYSNGVSMRKEVLMGCLKVMSWTGTYCTTDINYHIIIIIIIIGGGGAGGGGGGGSSSSSSNSSTTTTTADRQ